MKTEKIYLSFCFLNRSFRASRELEGSLATLTIVMFYDAHSTHSGRVHFGEMMGIVSCEDTCNLPQEEGRCQRSKATYM